MKKRSHYLYQTHANMKNRCYNKNNPCFKFYGGRGIKVCDEWLGVDGFWNFVKDLGDRPEGLTLDRTDNNLGYSPHNCKWASKLEQSLNTRNVEGAQRFTYNNQTKTIREWAEFAGIKKSTLSMRLTTYKYPIDKALGL